MKGLTKREVEECKKKKLVNKMSQKNSQSVLSIFCKNIFTYFNGIFFLIAILLIGAKSYRSLTFLPVIIANTIIGIFQQIRAKQVLDRLSLLDKTEYTVIRDGTEQSCPIDELVLGDVVRVDAGKQIPADGNVVEGMVYVNESLLTGEADEIEKKVDSELKSGSFVVSGSCFMKLSRVGDESYVAQIMKKAKETKEKKSEMIQAIEKIIKIAGILIIPVGLLLFIQSVLNGNTISSSIVSSIAAVIGMIPEGMYLLTTVALAISATNLAKNQVLLHDMRSIETLARVDVLCVDKTGTITNENMNVTEVFSAHDRNDLNSDSALLNQYIHTIHDSNITMDAIRNYFGNAEALKASHIQEFSSKLKYSCVQVEDVEYRLGAPEFLMKDEIFKQNASLIEQRANLGQRVLAFVKIEKDQCSPLCFVSLENEIRENAKEIFTFFNNREVEIKVISGDNPLTVSKVAKRAGILHSDLYVDANTLKEEDMDEAVSKYTVFGRVKPEQKKRIVEALKAKKKKVAMTGDGVNDILAMKEADCSIAMGSGSSAAREVAQVVLMDSDFSHLKNIVSEGRKDINNITRSATLFLYKNMFSLFLAIFSIINAFQYPLQPSQISLVSMFNIGIPAFLLALEKNESKQKDNFIKTTMVNALPAAITSFLGIATLEIFSIVFKIPQSDIGTASTYLLSVVGFIILFGMCKPFKPYTIMVYVVCLIGFLFSITYLYDLFSIQELSLRCWMLCGVFAIGEVTIIRWCQDLVHFITQRKGGTVNEIRN